MRKKNNFGQEENQLSELNKSASEAANLRFSIEKEIAVAQTKIDQATQQIQRLEKQNSEQQSLQRGFFLQMQEAEGKTLQFEQQLAVQKELEEDTQWQIEDNQQQTEVLREQLSQNSRQYDALKNEYTLLKSLAESLEGHGDAVKFLNQNKDWRKEGVSLFSDILYCQPEYRTAIESYLSPYLSYYVVPQRAQALQAIQLLEQSRKGKANFFILSNEAQISTNTDFPPCAEAISALSLLQAEAQYLPLLGELLANVWLLPSADLIPSTGDKNAVFISQDGKFVQKANFLGGGSALAFEGKKIGRQKNMELMAEQLQTLLAAVETDKKALAHLQQQLQALRQIDHKKNIQHLEQQISQWQRQQLIAKSKIDNFQQQQAQQEEDSQRQEQLLRIYRREQAERNTLLQEQTQKAAAAAQYLQQEQQRIQLNKEQLSAQSQSANQKNIEVLRQQNTLATLEKDISFARQQIQDIAQRVAQGQETTSNAAQEVIETEKQIAEIQILLQEMYEKKTLYQQQVELSEKAFFVHRGNINQQEEELQQLNRQYQNSLQLINQLQNNFSQTKVQLSTLAERVRIEFEININEVINQEPDRAIFEAADLDERVQKLRQKLQNYGAVNYMAIEAYDETKTRFDFISEQRADLIKAKELLLETLREIEAAATELFMVAFTTVRTHFISVFRSLFDADDTCDLLLSNPTSPLESRIEIVAKPKGKKPLSINQLSGGEKTLTATALLFALYLLKPAPFCIFDEVDAPLDDANIAKFNHIIRDFSKNSQFIVVTHNKKTMESVNIMYGVTMVEGVSRVVPVDFRAFA